MSGNLVVYLPSGGEWKFFGRLNYAGRFDHGDPDSLFTVMIELMQTTNVKTTDKITSNRQFVSAGTLGAVDPRAVIATEEGEILYDPLSYKDLFSKEMKSWMNKNKKWPISIYMSKKLRRHASKPSCAIVDAASMKQPPSETG